MSQSLSPGGVKTEFFIASGREVPDAALLYQLPLLESQDIADAVLYVLGTPPHVQVLVILKRYTVLDPSDKT
jgi:NADP+-dependent farnesol dehydrogenase